MNSADFKRLQTKWYKKLAKSGFKDIESKSGDLVNTSTTGGVIDSRRTTWETQAEYYRLATWFLNDYPFRTKFERTIWTEHTNGLSARSIARKLNRTRRRKTDKTSVWEIINSLTEEMKKFYHVR